MKIQAFGAAWRCSLSISRMSSGDSTSRACCGDTSIQRTWSAAAGCTKALGQLRRWPRALLRACRSPAPMACTSASASATACAACGQGLQAGAQSCERARSSQRSLISAAQLAQRPGAQQPQLARRLFQRGGQVVPVAQATRLLQPDGQQVAREVDQLRRAQRGAEELHAGLDQLVGLVEHGHVHRGQQLGHAAVAQRHVGEEQVVVHHHQVGGHRLAPRLHHVAGLELRAFAAQAVLARRGHQRDHRRAFVQAVEFGQVAAARGLRPGLDARQRAHAPSGPASSAPWRACLQALQAQVAGAALQQRQRHRQAQRIAQARQVAQEELVLQALGGGADQRAPARQQQRHQVGEGLADAGAGFGHQRAAFFDGPRHLLRPGAAAPRAAPDRGSLRASAPSLAKASATCSGSDVHRARCAGRGRGRRVQAGVGGSSSSSRREIWSRSSKPALLQAAQRQVVVRQAQRHAVDHVVHIRVFHAQFDQLPLNRVQVVIHLQTFASWAASLYSQP